MQNSKYFRMAFLVVVAVALSEAESQTLSRERRELKMGNQAVLASIVVSRSPKGKLLCSENKLACVGPDKAELGLALIGARQTKASHSELINLLAYELDGSVAEDFKCYVFKAGRSIQRDLREASSKALAGKCHAEVDKLIRSRKENFEGLDESTVCASPDSIEARSRELSAAITRGTRCGAEDF